MAEGDGRRPQELVVEVFAIASDRWIALIEAPAGAFSTEAERPESVRAEVESAIGEVLGADAPSFRLVDVGGRAWEPALKNNGQSGDY